MYKISKFMHSTSLFFRVAFIVLISIICVFLLTCTITISISKDVLVDTFSKSNYKILNQITDRLGVLNDNKRYEASKKSNEDLKTKTPNLEEKIQNLSGGNQQKVLIARWLLTSPDILILDEPTRGIDVGAKYEIYTIINDLVEKGKAVIVISSELPEVLGLSDRIYVMNEGKIIGELDGKEATQEIIMSKIVSSK